MVAPSSRKGRAVLAPVSSFGGLSAPVSGEPIAVRSAAAPAAQSTRPASLRLAEADDSRFLTVEPDGRDDVTFMDRLRHALRTVFEAVQQPDEAAESAERALQAAERSLAAAEDAGGDYFVQLRVVGVEVAYAESGENGDAAYASYRRLGVEIGVARGGTVRAEDATVVGLDGNSFGLTGEQARTGLVSGTYRRVETAPAVVSGAAGDRLAAAQAGLARVKTMQGALKAYRSGDYEPLKQLLDSGQAGQAGRSAAVFPGIGTLAFN